MTYWSVRRCRRTKAVRKWVAVTSHPFFGSGFCWPESSSLPLIAHADDGTCIHTRTTRAHLLLIWNSKGTLWNLGDPRDSFLYDEGGGFLALFSPLALFPSFSRSRVSRALAARKSSFFFSFFFFTNERGSLRTFRRGTVKRHRDLGQRTFNVSDLYILFFENYLAWIAIKQYNRSMYYRLENRVGMYKNRKRFLSIK